MNSKLNPKLGDLEKYRRCPPPAEEDKYHRFSENESSVKNAGFDFFNSISSI